MMKSVTEYLECTAQKYPNKIAFKDDYKSVTFLELNNISKKIASYILSKNIFKKPIAIFLDKSVECIASFTGVAYSGNFYTPIDSSMPDSRIEKIIEVLNPELIITNEKNYNHVIKIVSTNRIVKYEDIVLCKKDEILLEKAKLKQIDTDILYILFTSGSTGLPKGVIISHRSVIDYIDWVVECFNITSKDILGNQAPLYFDLSIQDVYAPFKSGATTVLIDSSLFVFPSKLMEYLFACKINTIFWVPTALVLIANLKGLNTRYSPKLEKILFCGEVMPNKQLNIWRKKYPNALFVNLYGPTEITEVCTYYIVNREFDDSETLPIGIPCRNTDILVLDENDELVENSSVGELCVRGSSLSMGYYKDFAKTDSLFVQNPLNKNYPEKIYRTGDLVFYNKFGELEYVSRKDFQIKHLGHRIELGEIETAVSSVRGVELSCCVYDSNRNRIVLYYVGECTDEEVICALKMLVPDYMIPNLITKLESMPTNLNGKIDRQKLKEFLS